jgi:putative spermidine/putrescine transport system substrate-binding protein
MSLDRDSVSSWRDAIALERRQVLLLMAGALLAPRAAHAEAGEIVLANWGGTAAKAVTAAYADTCRTQLGLTLAVDGSGTEAGKVRAMVDAHHVIWDVMDLDLGNTAQLGAAGLMEAIDYAIVDKASVLPGLTSPWGIGSYLYSYIFAVNQKVVKGAMPKTWADFWNVKDFPGKRGLPGGSQGVWEAALLADGVAPDKLYPLDLDRAVVKIKEIKPHCVFWKSGAQSEDLLRQQEVVASLMWSNRAVVVRRQMKEITWSWDHAILASSGWGVPKGNPAGRDAAMKFIQIALSAAGQAKVFEIVGMSPSNPAASALIPAEERPYDATAFADRQIPIDFGWYGQHADAAEAKYLDAISS